MRHLRRLIWLIGILALAVGLAACSTQAPPTPAPTATPKPPAAEPKPAPTPTAKPVVAQPTATAAPTAPAKTAASPTTAPAAPATRAAALSPEFANLSVVVAVQSAQAYVERAEFHEMAEEIGKSKEIQPGYVGEVRNVLAVVNAVSWPAALAREQQKLLAELKVLETTLVGNKVPEAQKAADAVHEAEHDLSKATFVWLAGQGKLGQAAVFQQNDANHLLGCIGIQSAQAYVERAGFHEIAEEIEKTSQIQPGYIGKVRNAMVVADAVPWPAELTKEQQRLMADMRVLEAALVGNRVQEAQKAADAAHESEHDFSKAMFGWLGGQKHNFGAMMPMMGADRMMQGVMMTGIQSAQAYVEGGDFHEMAEEIEKSKEIKPGYITRVRNVMAVAGAVPWPAELAKEQQKLLAELRALETALVGNKVPEAQKAADAVHEAEHDLSQATFAWLGTRKAG